MNLLHLETSPYLLQHAQNPVHWRAWNPESQKLASDHNKLIIVSSGYSACHWCHVMEHECFEDEDVAKVMNRDYVSIKVDREERPDIDAIYMKAVQLMTRQGGWPMNVICLPDGRPVWGGTYFPKREWIESLEQLAEMYREDPSKMIEYAEKLHSGIEAVSLIESPPDNPLPGQEVLQPLIQKWKRSFDADYGGYGRAPKFMLPNNFRFLLRYGYQKNDPALIEHVKFTLNRMAWGGLFDVVGGGFSRYSVDMRWHVPHFEKMLYDNGQLVSLYCDAYKLTQDSLYKEVIEKTLSFVSRELSDGDGGFFSALDADSINNEGELEEGAFYVWRKDELQSVLKDDFTLFSTIFNVNDFGHWEHGNYVLIRNRPLEEIAKSEKIPVADISEKKKLWEALLLSHREKRSRPRTDDKRLTSWNAMMLNGFVDAYKALGSQEYLDVALANADFILRKLWSPEGHLFRNFNRGRAAISGYLDDYAFTAGAFLNLYTATANSRWLDYARQLTDYAVDRFYEESSGFFTFSSDPDGLIAKHYEIEDNVIPASNSVMAKNLSRLGVYYSNVKYEQISRRMTAHIIPLIDYPSAYSNWMDVLMDFSGYNRELAIVGKDAARHLSEINRQYLPNVLIAASDSPSALPFLADRFADDRMLFYVCRNKTCARPETEFTAAMSQLKSESA